MPLVSITDLSWGGEGVGRSDGKVVFVPFALPGEVVEVALQESKKDYDRGKVIRVLEPSPYRVIPPCPHFGDCGGCQLQHLSSGLQSREKERLFRRLMVHGLKMPTLEILPILESPQAFGYRHRLHLKGALQEGRFQPGFFRSRSHEVIPIQKCLLANQTVNRFLADFQDKADQVDSAKWPVEMEVQALEDQPAGQVVLSGRDLPGPELRRQIDRHLRRLPGIKGVFFQDLKNRGLLGETPFSPAEHAPGYRLPAAETGLPRDLRMAYFPSVFSQVNLKLNALLMALLLKQRLCSPSERVLDLFCGQGNLSLPFSFQAKEVLGVEAVALAVENARWNQLRNGVLNCDFLKARAEEGLALLKKKGFRPDLIILDPPRSGVKELMPALIGFKAPRILYLSCDPMTLVRDLRLFLEPGWKITWSQPVDFFPQTYHLESITLLEN